MKKGPKPDESEEWLTTYADMMTLLMTFFVLLFSMSTLDPIKMEQFGDAMGKAMGKQKIEKAGKVSLLKIAKDVQKIVEQQNMEDYVEVSHSYRGVTIGIKSDILFEKGSAVLNPYIFPILDKFKPTIMNSIYQIAVEGHTDSDPIHSEIYPSNWELSTARASGVVNYYIRTGVPADRFRAIGFAATRPKVPNTTTENKKANRRVEMTFLAIS